ncbi:glycosyltransferase family 4 protein [Methanothermobacter thermautotrophicus]|jgi:D-inositol-3-phosphate glycosyltransferase|uniref:Glycosyltransferase family 4 protein n=1 Tax=Methanothermobacter thermautotrophicus TaxID=145262 RepID=A0A842YRI2_METTF|nr:glycosyltransferase family 4 protein [Methanothermobacter thermautotrophicus]MBE2900714.1 glycosyltransferase family 4 protein [Methanothermobacter thermautotrophicus]MCQ8905129.1 glycosyltransferase family 4 protein [Methanothermobacter sp.]HOQ19130.1 glycosyltransferase family 4 protein [Methanothermobacter thermautotrophicus]
MLVQGVLVISNMYPSKKGKSFGSFVKVHVDAFRRHTDIEQFLVANTDQRKGLPRLIKKYGDLLLRSIWYSIRKPFDVIHAHYLLPTGLIGLLCHWISGKPLIVTVHGSDVNKLARKNSLLFKISGYVLRRASAVITVSRDLRDKVVEEFGVDGERVHIINMGVDTDIFRPLDRDKCRERLGLPLNRRVILFVGNIIPSKGVHYLIESLREVEVGGVKCIILGAHVDEEYLKTLRGMAESINADVEFFEPVPYSEVAIWMNAADVFVLPSLEEGFGLVALEALACGTPVIATATGGIREFVIDSETGYTVSPGDSSAIADRINSVLDPANSSKVDSMRKKGIRIARSFSTLKQIERILEIYRKVA